MPRKPAPRSSAELAREIERLKEQHAKLAAAENARRGELIGHLLDGPHADDIRQVLDPIVTGPDDRALFGLGAPAKSSRRSGPAAVDTAGASA